MGVKVRERPAGSGKWWVFTDFRGKRTARYIPQGKRAAEKVAFEIATKLDLIKQTEKHGLTASPREVILGRADCFPSFHAEADRPAIILLKQLRVSQVSPISVPRHVYG